MKLSRMRRRPDCAPAALARRAAVVALVAAALLAAAPPAVAATDQPPAAAAYSPDHDLMFAQPFIDVDEWRDAPVRHRYVHGGFKGTAMRFSFYFPDEKLYRGALLPICDTRSR